VFIQALASSITRERSALGATLFGMAIETAGVARDQALKSGRLFVLEQWSESLSCFVPAGYVLNAVTGHLYADVAEADLRDARLSSPDTKFRLMPYERVEKS
jgi:hypothetical protein